MKKSLLLLSGLLLTSSNTAWAQSPDQADAPLIEQRLETTTDRGDTGLWFVPTGDVAPSGTVSMSMYRVNFDCPRLESARGRKLCARYPGTRFGLS